MSRALLQEGGGDAPAPGGAPVLFGEQEILDAVTWGSGAFNPFQTPGVMVADWLGFVVVSASEMNCARAPVFCAATHPAHDLDCLFRVAWADTHTLSLSL